MIKLTLFFALSLFTSMVCAQELATIGSIPSLPSATIGPIPSPPLSFDGVRFAQMAEDQSNMKVYFEKADRITKQKAVSLENGKLQIVHYQIFQPIGDLDSVTIPLEKLSLRDRSGSLIPADEIGLRLENAIPVFCMIGKETDYAQNEALMKLVAPDAIILQIDRHLTVQLEKLGLLTRH